MKRVQHWWAGPRRVAFGWMVWAVVVTSAQAAAEADLLVAYDQSYADSVGGDENARVLIANAVAASNAINDRSGTGARLRICGYHKTIGQAGRSTLGGYVGWLANETDGNLDDVTAVANARGADLVAFVCAPSAGETSAAVAQQPGRYAAYAPAYFWAIVTAHETGGHNYGCDHRGGRENPKTVMLHNYCGGGAQPYFSNPNMWLNGVRLRGEGSCLGPAVDNGDNAYLISTRAQEVADRRSRTVTAPLLNQVVHHWRFDQPAKAAPPGTVVSNSFHPIAHAVVLGNGAVFTGTGLRLPGGSPGGGTAYVQLPPDTLAGLSNMTLEVWARPLSGQNWSRLLDFHNGTAHYVMLSLTRGTDLGSQRFESVLAGTRVTRDSGLPTEPGMLFHYTITYTALGSSGGRWTWYRNGDEVGTLGVNYPLSALQPAFLWLGRSAYAADALAHCEILEVRLSRVSLNRDQVLAHFALGPHWEASTVVLTGDDPIGSSSFAAAGRWSDGQAPSFLKTYSTYRFRLRTPEDAISRAFAGQRLRLDGGSLTWKGTASSAIQVRDLVLAGDCELLNAGSGTWTLTGGVTVESPEAQVRAANGPIHLAASLRGFGGLLLLNQTVTLAGDNRDFQGRIIIGDGRFSSLRIDSEERLGANPAIFTADQLTLNRGILYTSGNVVLDDSNRGIRVGPSGAIFQVSAGATLTLAVPLSSPVSGQALVTVPQYPNPSSGMLIKENAGTLVLTHPNNSHVGEVVIQGGTLKVSEQGRLNNGDQALPVQNHGTLIFDLVGNQVVSGPISGAGALIKAGSGWLTLRGTNSMTGPVTIQGGVVYANPGNAASNRTFSYVSQIVIHSNATLRSGPNGLFGWDGTQTRPIVVHQGGMLTIDGPGNDVNVGLVTMNGGTLAGGPSPVWGSWNFGRAARVNPGSARLVVTEDSVVTATDLMFHSGAWIEVRTGKTLLLSGSLNDATSEGVCSLILRGGGGTLVLTSTNGYSGPTVISNGTLLVHGLIGRGPVTVHAGATLGGRGIVLGPVTIRAGGLLSPGPGPETLTVDNSVNLEPGSSTWLEVDPVSGRHDQIRMRGLFQCNGLLVITNLGGTFQAGNRFVLWQAAATTGNFAAIELPGLPDDLAWEFDPVAGELTVVRAIPAEPVRLHAWWELGALHLEWPSGQGWRLEGKTNAALVTDPWYPVPGTERTNRWVLRFEPGVTNAFFRLVQP
ncbi:MAG: autotransporter-associated beta strand repeat-containing protein [Verrucomicrobiota bacterium]|nr:autotransporter-associated beta strand repeat-containing protein [Verrucomicrobiota bacterium]